MTNPDADTVLDSKIAALRQEFLGSLPVRIQKISGLLALLNDEPEHRHELYRQVHSLTGSLGIFEYTDASRTARSMCHILEPDIALDDVLYAMDELNVLAAQLFSQIDQLGSSASNNQA